MSYVSDRPSNAATMLQSALALTVLVGAAGTALARPGHEPSVIAKRSREELAAYGLAKPVYSNGITFDATLGPKLLIGPHAVTPSYVPTNKRGSHAH